ncbi:MAG: UDP-N-acetylmuramate--L-alanine ligase [Actinomycetota bacterium]|nr:UDP-N-acetylmuramate--L-alanine ligase [Actinomycetota bacterium]
MSKDASFKKVHFIGIGGAGMSGIAKVLLARGFAVSGSDIKDSSNIAVLKGLGADIKIGHASENIDGADTVVISSAIKEKNVELIRAAETGLTILKRAEMIAKLSEGMINIAVSGTHGKTTTTSMISMIFESARLDPTFLIGGELNDIGSNAKSGDGPHFITEADESDASFLFLRPNIGVITNIEEDHLDHYASLSEIKETFLDFASLISEGGDLVIFKDHSASKELIENLKAGSKRLNIQSYGLSEGCDFRATEIDLSSFGSRFKLEHNGDVLEIELNVPGVHNILNSLAATAVARLSGVSGKDISRGLSSFSGVKRRFQRLGAMNGATFIDDYAHHPTEITATLKAARGGDWKRILCIFQPHRYSRTKSLCSLFGEAFGHADKIIITDVYGAGEAPEPGVTGKLIVDAIREKDPSCSVIYLPTKGEVKEFLGGILADGDLVITMGAGDIHTVGEDMIGSTS